MQLSFSHRSTTSLVWHLKNKHSNELDAEEQRQKARRTSAGASSNTSKSEYRTPDVKPEMQVQQGEFFKN